MEMAVHDLRSLNTGRTMRIRCPWRVFAAFALLASLATFAAAAGPAEDKSNSPPDTVDGAALVQALRGGGHVIYFRHGRTDLTTHDTDRANLAQCATQRKLSEEGRQEMVQIGRLFVQMRIPVGAVLTSPYCRAIDTVRLAFGRATVEPDLEHTIAADAATTRHRGAALARLLGTPPGAGTNTVLAGHTGNLQEAAGIWPSPEGVAIVFKPDGQGRGRFVATVPPTRWVELARLAGVGSAAPRAGPGAPGAAPGSTTRVPASGPRR